MRTAAVTSTIARAVVAGLMAVVLGTGTHASAERPNILLLMAEDLSPRVGAWGDAVARTPNIDRLAQQGVRYTRVFTTAGVCGPSRAAMITGQYQISFGAQHMRTSTSPLGEYLARPGEEVKAFPELLRAAGYYTFTDAKLDYQFSGMRAGSGPFTIWDVDGAADTAWRGRAAGQPFFGLVNFLETHESGVMRPVGVPNGATHVAMQRMRALGGLVAAPVTDPKQVLLPPYYPDLPEVRADLARHYDNIAAMDTRVGRILASLEADGLTGNTIVIWTSDHGDGLPRAKRELFDSGLHVPFVLSVPHGLRATLSPEIPAPGASTPRLVSFVDIAPTVLQLAGVAPPPFLHGVSAFGPPREYVHAARDRMAEVTDRQRAVRDARYKYIASDYPDLPGGHALEYRDNIDMVRAMRAAFEAGELNADQARWFEPPGAVQLYDLENDPFELHNLAGRGEMGEVQVRLAAELARWRASAGDSGALDEAQLRASLLEDGQVPTTPPPVASVQNGEVVLSAQHGASIGWRVAGGAWRLYVGPFARPAAPDGGVVQLEARAVRYGWRESASLAFASDGAPRPENPEHP